MAENSPGGLAWLLQLKRTDTDWLADIRHWQHLRVATEDECIWVKGFRDEEISAVAVRSIPVKRIWYQKEHLLFPQGSLVPSRKAPTLLWTPIGRGLPLQLPPWNHNYFGFEGQVAVRLIASTEERPATAMLAPLSQVWAFIESAGAFRLKMLRWTIINGAYALIVGVPLLPIPAEVFWIDEDYVIPAGYDLQSPVMKQFLKAQASKDGDAAYILWHRDGYCSSIPKKAFGPLSIGAFRQSISLLQHAGNSTDESAD